VVGTVSLGFVYTLLTTTFAVLAVRRAQGTLITSSGAVTKTAGLAAKPFSEASWNLFWQGALVTGIISILATRAGNHYASPLEMVFLAFLTVTAYIWSANLPSGFVKVVHPLVTGSLLVLAGIRGLSVATTRDFFQVLRSYRTNTLSPMKMGAGDLLMYLLGPSVVSFAIAVYSRRLLLQQNLLVVVIGTLVASAGGLFGTAAFVRLISLGNGSSTAMLRLSVLARNITTALAMALTNMIGGNISIIASVVCLTGILGGTYGRAILDALGIRDPICRGLGMGCSSQGLGVAALASEPEAFPFAAIGMILTAISATTLTAVPSIQKALIRTATGGLPTP
jgi:putative effector of murein hydrolase